MQRSLIDGRMRSLLRQCCASRSRTCNLGPGSTSECSIDAIGVTGILSVVLGQIRGSEDMGIAPLWGRARSREPEILRQWLSVHTCPVGLSYPWGRATVLGVLLRR